MKHLIISLALLLSFGANARDSSGSYKLTIIERNRVCKIHSYESVKDIIKDIKKEGRKRFLDQDKLSSMIDIAEIYSPGGRVLFSLNSNSYYAVNDDVEIVILNRSGEVIKRQIVDPGRVAHHKQKLRSFFIIDIEKSFDEISIYVLGSFSGRCGVKIKNLAYEK